MTQKNRQLPRLPALPDGWSMAVLAIAAVVLAPVLSVAVIAFTPTQNI